MSYQRTVDEVGFLREVRSEADPGQQLYADYRAQRVFGWLDALRAFSILAVVWHHALLIPPWFVDLVPGSVQGFLGVDLFFVLSGFLIVTLLLREREQKSEISLKNFYLRRSLRIFPLYYGALLAYAVLFFLVRPHGAGGQAFREDLPYLLFYLTNWQGAHGMLNMTWSLSSEEQFYLAWPPLERVARRWTVPIVLTVILVSELIQFGALDSQLSAWFGWGPHEPGMLRQTTFAPICLGVLLAHALHHRPSFERIASVLAHRFVAPSLALTLLVGMQFLTGDMTGTPRLLVHLLMTALLASVVVREDHGLSALCHLRPLVRIGALSYGVYILHMPVIGIVNAVFARFGVQPAFGDFVLATALVVGIAELSFRYYETPFLKLKHRFT